MQVLEKFDEDIAKGIKNIARLDSRAYQEFLQSEGLPNSMQPKEYADHAARQVLHESTAREMQALREGFLSAVPLRV